jgi:hypothetical protein
MLPKALRRSTTLNEWIDARRNGWDLNRMAAHQTGIVGQPSSGRTDREEFIYQEMSLCLFQQRDRFSPQLRLLLVADLGLLIAVHELQIPS